MLYFLVQEDLGCYLHKMRLLMARVTEGHQLSARSLLVLVIPFCLNIFFAIPKLNKRVSG